MPTGPAPPPALSPLLRLVHEDDALLVIEKPPGLLTIGTERERERTAYRLVWAYLRGRAAATAALHRPPPGPGDLGPPGRREDPGGAAPPPGPVRGRQRGPPLRRDRGGCRLDGRRHAPRRPPRGALAPRPPHRSDPTAAAGGAGARGDHLVPRARAPGGRDARRAPARNRAAPPDPRPTGEARPSGRRGRAATAHAGIPSAACASTPRGSPSAIRRPGRPSSSRARRLARSPKSAPTGPARGRGRAGSRPRGAPARPVGRPGRPRPESTTRPPAAASDDPAQPRGPTRRGAPRVDRLTRPPLPSLRAAAPAARWQDPRHPSDLEDRR